MTAPAATAAKVYRVTAAELEQLTDDGDMVELESGARLYLHIRPDDYPVSDSFGEGVVYGKLEWTRDSDYGPRRPADFTGRAEIMARSHRESLWWEPFDVTDLPGFLEQGTRAESYQTYRQSIADLLEYGFSIVGLELRERVTDSRGGVHYVELETEWLGGVEPFADPAYVASIVSDLLAELESVELEQNGAEQ